MSQKALIVDDSQCTGCVACEVACKQEHNVDIGARLLKVLRDGPRMVEGKVRMRYTVAHCVQCVRPSCRDACAAGAIHKRDDGVVLIDGELCTGCGACVQACLFGVMAFEQARGMASKCDLCVARTDLGLEPACASACPSRCIHFGRVDEQVQADAERRALAWRKPIVR